MPLCNQLLIRLLEVRQQNSVRILHLSKDLHQEFLDLCPILGLDKHLCSDSRRLIPRFRRCEMLFVWIFQALVFQWMLSEVICTYLASLPVASAIWKNKSLSNEVDRLIICGKTVEYSVGGLNNVPITARLSATP